MRRALDHHMKNDERILGDDEFILLSPYHCQSYQLGNVRSCFIDQLWFVTLAAMAGVLDIQRVLSSDRILSELCGRTK